MLGRSFQQHISHRASPQKERGQRETVFRRVYDFCDSPFADGDFLPRDAGFWFLACELPSTRPTLC